MVPLMLAGWGRASPTNSPCPGKNLSLLSCFWGPASRFRAGVSRTQIHPWWSKAFALHPRFQASSSLTPHSDCSSHTPGQGSMFFSNPGNGNESSSSTLPASTWPSLTLGLPGAEADAFQERRRPAELCWKAAPGKPPAKPQPHQPPRGCRPTAGRLPEVAINPVPGTGEEPLSWVAALCARPIPLVPKQMAHSYLWLHCTALKPSACAY